MSYIRACSSPEGLYVFPALTGDVHILGKNGHTYGKVPQLEWDRFCKGYVKYYEDYTRGPLSIKSEYRGEDNKMILRYRDLSNDPELDFEVEMWEVTWFYIVRTYEHNRIRKGKA